MRVVFAKDVTRDVAFKRLKPGDLFRFVLSDEVYMRVRSGPKEPKAVNIHDGTVTSVSSLNIIVSPVEGTFQEILP
jgi:hypothetical protein